ncbi:hypothetical protein [Paenibacillus alginolyticus]|uniref:Uncharacterized protein n=1 Tax=Paenibacillus alginolyticus TaxID=59839 RepID=A0ABT4G5B9_9BACL|nr:hypothetical protein [Paenibacillus alginolyticus]MCY9691378.1 hypothetical protein [Paenibacillus alginolyticus]MEC0146486.1 hypothetical protein [Paenibacillus alginolyticus]
MERIFPICEASCRPYLGSPICAVLHDGTHYYGTIEGIDGDQLIINGYRGEPGEVGIYGLNKNPAGKKQSGKKQSGKKAKQVKTSAFFPGFGFERFFFPFAALAFLFAFPFFGFPFFF